MLVLALLALTILLPQACQGARPPSGDGPAPSPAAQSQEEAPAGPDITEGLTFFASGWKTDFSKHSVPLKEIMPGGPPRDGIPPIDRPKLISVEEATSWLKDPEPVVSLQVKGEARAYPLQILIWHEIVNDQVGDTSVAVTFCPLCNTAIAFDRRLEGRTYDLGTTGNLRYSDLVMWDRQTESWWQQITGEAIVGELTGKRLNPLPVSIVSWKQFRESFPQGRVLSRDTGFNRSYGRNPYVGYDDVKNSPFLYTGPSDDRLRPMERVATVTLGGEEAAYPFSVLQSKLVVNDVVGKSPVVVMYSPEGASALDGADIASSRQVGSTGVFRASLQGQKLTFQLSDGEVTDRETGSAWNVLGQAVRGPSAGQQLEPVVHGNHFWFAWAAFKPNTRIYR